MTITYLDTGKEKKLFSFYRHDFQKIEIDGEIFILDGGITTDPDSYARTTGGELKQGEVKDLIEDIRNLFTWGKRTNEKGELLQYPQQILLKELDSSHICAILSHLNNRGYYELPSIKKRWHIINQFFIEELAYRIKNNLI